MRLVRSESLTSSAARTGTPAGVPVRPEEETMVNWTNPIFVKGALLAPILMVVASLWAIDADTGSTPIRLGESEEVRCRGGLICHTCAKVTGIVCGLCTTGTATCVLETTVLKTECVFQPQPPTPSVAGCSQAFPFWKCVFGGGSCNPIGSIGWCGVPKYPQCPKWHPDTNPFCNKAPWCYGAHPGGNVPKIICDVCS